MLRIFATIVGGYALLNMLLYFFGFVLLTAPITIPLGYLGRHTGIFDDGPSVMTVEPISVQQGSSVTIKVSNKSGEPMERFTIQCFTNRNNNWLKVTDMSGIAVGQTDVRSYKIPDINDPAGVTEISGCSLKSHFEGNPSDYDTMGAERQGDGGWGDRLPGVASATDMMTGEESLTTAPVYPGDLDPNIDYN